MNHTDSLYPAGEVESDVALNGEECLLLGDFALKGHLDEESASVTLHLDHDLGQSIFTNVFKFGQFTSAEHHLCKVRGKKLL